MVTESTMETARRVSGSVDLVSQIPFILIDGKKEMFFLQSLSCFNLGQTPWPCFDIVKNIISFLECLLLCLFRHTNAVCVHIKETFLGWRGLYGYNFCLGLGRFYILSCSKVYDVL